MHCVYGAVLLLLGLFCNSSGACAEVVPLVVTNTTKDLDSSLRQVIADAAPVNTIINDDALI
jgi:hypothetical protein